MYPKPTVQEFLAMHDRKDLKAVAAADDVKATKPSGGYVARGDLKFDPSVRQPRKKQKSKGVAYLMWMCGGIFGLHLLYLGRDRQAFLYWWTVGGYMGMGVLRDFFRLPSYVRDANDERSHMEQLTRLMISRPKPGLFSDISRLVAQVMVGNMWFLLFDAAVPREDILPGVNIRILYIVFAPLGAALAVWLIGNIGRQQGSITWALIGSYMVLIFVPFFGPLIMNWCCVISTLLFNLLGKQWRRTPYPRHSKRRRFLRLLGSYLLFAGLMSSFLYYNATLKANNEEVKLRDAMGHFLRSPMFQEFKQSSYRLYNDTWHQGPRRAFSNFVDLLDPQGRKHAFKVLQLPMNATQQEIKDRLRDLSRQWHPDKHLKGQEGQRQEAHNVFMEVQAAGNVLLDSKKRRQRNRDRHNSL